MSEIKIDKSYVVQGYYFARPMPAAGLSRWIEHPGPFVSQKSTASH